MIILTIIENRTQLFLKSCSNANTFSDVDSFHLNYSDPIAKLLQREIPSCMIASCVMAAYNESNNKKYATKRSSPTKGESEDGDESDTSPPKKKKAKTAAKGTKNPERIPDKWKSSYGNNSNLFSRNLSTIPKMDGESMCLKWHGLGICSFGDKCKRKVTHKPMSATTKSEYESWVHDCQTNN
jgi:hypothetical protein